MFKTTPLLEHLTNPDYQEKGAIVSPDMDDRCLFHYAVQPGGWSLVAKGILDPKNANVAWFPDANVAFLRETEPVWDALRVAGTRTLDGSALVSGVVEAEMQPWLSDPFELPDRAKLLRDEMNAGSWLRRLRYDSTRPLSRSIGQYANLISSRRHLATDAVDGKTRVGTLASDRSKTMNAIINAFGQRAKGLAKKGRVDMEKKGTININDEAHCLIAILFALENKRAPVIITADSDYIEIFFKAQWFLDAHYRAWLAAPMIKNGFYGRPAGEVKDSGGLFKGPLTLYRRPTCHLNEVLPPNPTKIHLSVFYVAPDNFVHFLTFHAEFAMLEMLKIRAQTRGRCTNLFGEANVHVNLGPLTPKLDGLYIGVGKDSVAKARWFHEDVFMSRLDIAHSLHGFESTVPARHRPFYDGPKQNVAESVSVNPAPHNLVGASGHGDLKMENFVQVNLRFPVYILAEHNTVIKNEDGSLGVDDKTDISIIVLEPVWRILSLFTEEDAAKQNLRDKGMNETDWCIVPLFTRLSLLELLLKPWFNINAIAFDPKGPWPGIRSNAILSKKDFVDSILASPMPNTTHYVTVVPICPGADKAPPDASVLGHQAPPASGADRGR